MKRKTIYFFTTILLFCFGGGLASCKTPFECALGDMGEGCSVWGWELFYDYPDSSSGVPFRIVAVGASSVVYYSSDGLTWTETQVGSATQYNLQSVTHSGTNFVAVGENTVSTAETIWYSSDGVSWSEATVSSPCTTAAVLNDVVALNGRLMAVGGASTNTAPCVHYSSDHGVTWSAGAAPAATVALYRVATDGTNYIASAPYSAGTDIEVFLSTDGFNFATEPDAHPLASTGTNKDDNTLGTMTQVSGNSSQILLAGTDESSFAPSSTRSAFLTTGYTWTLDSVGIFGSNGALEVPRGFAYDGSSLVAVGDNCRIDITTDTANLSWLGGTNQITGCTGVTWTELIYASNKFIATGYDGSSNSVFGVSSTGGVADWTLTTFTTGLLNGIAHN